ncbi:MAG: hypothetical protein ACE5HS_19575 [bacterium]
MKSSMAKCLSTSLTCTLVVSAFFVGCQLNNATGPENKAAAPEIPPASTLVMEFDDFVGSQASLKSSGQGQLQLSRQNWQWAAGNVAVWNTLIRVGLATPVAAFLESFRHQPVQQPDDSWVWSYDFMVLGIRHTAELYAKTTSEGIRWDMYISKENGFSNYHWFFGESNLVSTAGTWTLNGAVGEKPMLFIEWRRNLLEGTGDVKYRNVIPNHPENGGYIHHGITAESPYNAFYDIYNKGKDNHTNIEWHRLTKEGRVKDPLHFNDELWHCWQANLEDGDCS